MDQKRINGLLDGRIMSPEMLAILGNGAIYKKKII
jgi:hypothetical protein